MGMGLDEDMHRSHTYASIHTLRTCTHTDLELDLI